SEADRRADEEKHLSGEIRSTLGLPDPAVEGSYRPICVSPMENYQPEEEEVGPSLGLRRVARGAGGSLVAQVAGLGLGYVLHVCLAQWMGVDGYGLYTYVLAWTALLALPAAAGLPISVIRFLPAYQAHQQWGLLRGFLGWSISRTVLLGSVIVLLFGAGAWAVV